jgi:predicted dehydrogenase
MKAVSVGIIGAGFSANLHIEGLAKVFGVAVNVIAVSAGRKEHADAFAARHGIPTVYASYQDLLADPDIDVVCVCLPNAMHGPVIIAAAEAGKHIVCEKPLTGAFGMNLEPGAGRAAREREIALTSVAAIADAVKRNGVQFMYAENWIYAPSTVKTKRLLELAGSPIIDIRAEESHSGSHAPKSRRRQTAGGGALLVMGSHPIAAALHRKAFEGQLHGGAPIRPEAVTAEIAHLYASEAVKRAEGHNRLVSDWEDVETWANLVLAFTDGSRAVINASFAMLGGVRNLLEVYTTNAAYRSNMTPNNGLEVFTPDAQAFGEEYLHEKIESRTGWVSVSPDEDWVRGYPQEMQDFMECVAADKEPVSGLQLASDVIDVIYAAYQSAETGQRIKLSN